MAVNMSTATVDRNISTRPLEESEIDVVDVVEVVLQGYTGTQRLRL